MAPSSSPSAVADGRQAANASPRVSLAKGLFRLSLLVFALLVAFGWCYFIVPKLEAFWYADGRRPPWWAWGLFWASHFVIKYFYVFGTILLIVLYRRRSAFGIPARRHRGGDGMKRRGRRIGLRTALLGVAACALIMAALDAWLLGPYRQEKRAAEMVMRRGGNVILVDDAPRWLRRYVNDKQLDMKVAAFVNLGHSRVSDADMVELKAFRHCGQIVLSDTQVSDAGLKSVGDAFGGRWVDLSRTRVTDVSTLFGNESVKHPSGLKLSGNRIRRVGFQPRLWCPLQELDLSFTEVDDHALAAFPDGLVNLFDLNLSDTAVTDAGLGALHRLDGLRRLNLTNTKVTAAGVARLKSQWKGRMPLTVITGTTAPAPIAPRAAPATTPQPAGNAPAPK